jgi:hypothetical protein
VNTTLSNIVDFGDTDHCSNRITFSFFSRDYLKKWAAKGVHVVGWTVNTFDEKRYYETYLHSSYITDSMLEDCTPQF